MSYKKLYVPESEIELAMLKSFLEAEQIKYNLKISSNDLERQ